MKAYLETVKYALVRAIIHSVENDKNWDMAESNEKLYFYQLRAAGNVGVFEPFKEDQIALMDYLSRRRAGKRLCDYAWRAYAQSCVRSSMTD